MRGETKQTQYVIDITKPWHVAWWSAEFGVSERALLQAVSVVGTQARAVELYLNRKEVESVNPRLQTRPVLRHGLRRASGPFR